MFEQGTGFMAASKQIIVIGAGIIGASIAWHLTRAGAGVTIVEAGAPGGVATPASFAWINATWGNPEPYFRFRMRSIAEWTRLAAAVPGIELAWTGGLCWDLSPADLAAFAAEHGSWGYGIRRVDRAEIVRIEPNLMDPPEFALHVPGEGAVEPAPAARALVAAAVRDGARLMSGEPVLALAVENGRVIGVSDGRRHSSRRRGRACGRHCIARHRRDRRHWHAARHAARPARPFASACKAAQRAGAGGSARICARLPRGVLLPAPTSAAPIQASMQPKRPGCCLPRRRRCCRGGDALKLDFHTLGYRPTPADGFPMIGRVDGVDGLYVTVMHSGITLAPIVGLFATQELTTGERDPLLAPYRPSRFAQ